MSLKKIKEKKKEKRITSIYEIYAMDWDEYSKIGDQPKENSFFIPIKLAYYIETLVWLIW